MLLREQYSLSGRALDVVWKKWFVDSIEWSHGTALRFLQGETLLNLMQPMLLLFGVVRPVYAPIPGMNGVVLAEVLELSESVSVAQLFSLLAPGAHRA